MAAHTRLSGGWRVSTLRSEPGPPFACKPAVLALGLALFGLIQPAESKTPGTTYCFREVCHRVHSLEETQAARLRPVSVIASYYDDCRVDRFNACGLTSSGAVFEPEADDNAASPIYPDGTSLLVWSPTSGQAAVIRINNAGPYISGRLLDVSRGLAERLGFVAQGVARLELMVLTAPTPSESTYEYRRTYSQLPGVIGAYPSLQAAWQAWSERPTSAETVVEIPDRMQRDPLSSQSPAVPALKAAIAGAHSGIVGPIVRIGGRGVGSARSRSGVVLKPIALRRPLAVKLMVRRQLAGKPPPIR